MIVDGFIKNLSISLGAGLRALHVGARGACPTHGRLRTPCKDNWFTSSSIKGIASCEKGLFIYLFLIFVFFRHCASMGRREKGIKAFSKRQMPDLRDVRGQISGFYYGNLV